MFATGIGAALMEARTARGLSRDDAERATHIPLHHIEALESERFDEFPASVYLRGFLRSYSQYLGLDSDALLAKLPPEGPSDDEQLSSISTVGRRLVRDIYRPKRNSARSNSAIRSGIEADATQDESDELDFEPASTGRMRVPLDGYAAQQTHSSARMDPLGRLGWPQRPGEFDVRQPRFESAAGPRPTGGSGLPREPDREEKASVERRRVSPLMAYSHPLRRVPEDVQGLFSQRGQFMLLAVALGVLALWALSLVLSGGDVKPTVLSVTAVKAASAEVSVAPPPEPSLPRGKMPDVRGHDLASALSSLEQNQSIVPLVVQQTAGDGSGAQVVAQSPPPGVSVRSDTPVLLVTGKGP